MQHILHCIQNNAAYILFCVYTLQYNAACIVLYTEQSSLYFVHTHYSTMQLLLYSVNTYYSSMQLIYCIQNNAVLAIVVRWWADLESVVPAAAGRRI